MINSRWVKWTVLFVLTAVLAGLALPSCSPPPPVASITIGSPPLESSALIYIAEARGFFTRNNLEVTIEEPETGAVAYNALLNGEVDIAVPAEYPLVGSAFEKEGTSVIAVIDKAQYFFLVGRRDKGIERVADLSGKKVGLAQRTIAEFYLGRFLLLNGIDAQTVTLVNLNYSQSENAIISGTVDAVVSRPPYVSATTGQLGENAVVWQVQSSQALYAILTARNDWLNGHSEAVSRLLKSLRQAEDYLIKHPTESRAIVQQRLNFDDAYMNAVWSQNQFSLTLEQSLIVALEDEARWMISENLTTEKQVPDFGKYMYIDSLKKLKPEAVNIIR